MKNKVSTLAAMVAITLVTTGCSIKQEIKAVEPPVKSEVCIIQNTAVRDSFLPAYRASLNQLGCPSRILPAGASIVDCPVTSTYTARWSWDVAMYMSRAEIMVYQGGKPSGHAFYDSTRAGGRMDKFINAEQKVAELVRGLYVSCN